mgnify:CR=1 FL=1
MLQPKLLFMLGLGICAYISQQLNATELENLSLDEIMHFHIEAMGGLYNWQKIESIRLAGTVERDGQHADIVIIKKRPDKIRATVTIPIPGNKDSMFQLIRAHDGTTAWTATRQAGTLPTIQNELDDQSAANLLSDAGVMPKLMKHWRQGAKLRLLDPTQINGENAYTIQYDDLLADVTHTFYLSAKHFMTLCDKTEVAGTTTTTYIHSYQKHHNVFIPTSASVQSNEGIQSLLNTNSIEIGVGIYNDYFSIDEGLKTAER